MKILFVSSEVYPLIKTGGLADVAGTLPIALKQAGVDVKILLPAYNGVVEKLDQVDVYQELGDPFGYGPVTILQGTLPDSDVTVWLLDCPSLYHRDGGPYVGANGQDYGDNHLRFGLLSWAGALITQYGYLKGWQPDVTHAHDWQTGLLPAYLKSWGQKHPPVVFTIHNLQFTGVFDRGAYGQLALSHDLYHPDGLEYYHHFSMLKAGILYSDTITTVSPTYAKEIQTPAFGYGLDGLLRASQGKLSGILNGVDYKIWDPQHDELISNHYSSDQLEGKLLNKRALQQHNGLDQDDSALVFGVVSRLSEQKGLDLVLGAMPELLANANVQFVLLGSGDKRLEEGFLALAQRFPQRVGVTIGYDEPYSHLLQAGVDSLLVPSRFEPCGLTQLYALRYGTIPLVRHTGGLADSVWEHREGWDQTGFVFSDASVEELKSTMWRAVDAFKDMGHWQWLMRNAMAQDFAWSQAAKDYLGLYHALNHD